MNVDELKKCPAPLVCTERRILPEQVRESLYSDLNDDENFVFIVWDTVIYQNQYHASSRAPVAELEKYLMVYRPNVIKQFKDVEHYLDKCKARIHQEKIEEDVVLEPAHQHEH
jgi:hypothetical protein